MCSVKSDCDATPARSKQHGRRSCQQLNNHLTAFNSIQRRITEMPAATARRRAECSTKIKRSFLKTSGARNPAHTECVLSLACRECRGSALQTTTPPQLALGGSLDARPATMSPPDHRKAWPVMAPQCVPRPTRLAFVLTIFSRLAWPGRGARLIGCRGDRSLRTRGEGRGEGAQKPSVYTGLRPEPRLG
jgi:hypothetical protein